MGWPGRVLEGPAVPALHSWTSFRAASYRSMVVGKRVRFDGSLGAGFFPRALTHVSRVFVLVMLVCYGGEGASPIRRVACACFISLPASRVVRVCLNWSEPH